MLGGMDTAPSLEQSRRTPADHEVPGLLREQVESGLSLAAWARQRGIGTWKLYKARRAAAAGDAPRPTFDPVTIVPSRSSARFELEVGHGLVLRIPPDFDETSLRRLVEVLARC
jgi:hypothetical protein